MHDCFGVRSINTCSLVNKWKLCEYSSYTELMLMFTSRVGLGVCWMWMDFQITEKENIKILSLTSSHTKHLDGHQNRKDIKHRLLHCESCGHQKLTDNAGNVPVPCLPACHTIQIISDRLHFLQVTDAILRRNRF